MRNLKNIAKDYLSKSTDFAVQIVGSWGYGKTFYYRNTLESLIFNTPTYNDANKKYKPIYISLFGLKSIEDIATKIVLELYQSKLFKNYYKTGILKKRLKITQSVLKIGFRGFLNFSKLGNANDYLTDIQNIGENVLGTNELVVCFDDLERKDSSLNIEDLTGYINSLVDEGIKVMLISNEDLLLQKGEEYKNLKEKIIGITVEFVPDTKATLQNIIKLRYESFPTYKTYLEENIELLSKFSNSIKNNFRHIIYALDTLQNCYSFLKKDILDVKHEISERLLTELNNISVLILALSAEYKSSNLKYSDIESYSNNFKFLHDIFSDSSPGKKPVDEKDKTDLDRFIEKYEITLDKYQLFESIYYYVTGYQEFNTSLFIGEFTRNFRLEKGQILPQYELLNSLSYQSCFNLSDEEYKEKTLKLIEFAKEGAFNAPDFLSVMHYAERLNNVLSLDLEKVKNEISEGLKLSIANTGSNAEFNFTQFEMTGRSEGISPENKEIYKIGMKEIAILREKNKKEKIESYAILLTSNFTEFQYKYNHDRAFQSDLAYDPFLNYITPSKLFDFVITGENEVIHFLKYFFEERYKSYEILKKEYENLKEVTNKLHAYKEEQVQQHGKTIRNYLLTELVDSLIKLEGIGKGIIEAAD